MFFEQEKIQKIYLTGFSFGGLCALFLAIYFPTHFTRLILIAPDGFYKSSLCRINTLWSIRVLFHCLTQNFEQFHFIIIFLKYVGLIDTSMNRFIQEELSDQVTLKRV